MTFDNFLAVTPSMTVAEKMLARIVWDFAIEESAKACEALYLEHDCKHPTDYANGMLTASDVLEQRIRAIKA